MVDISTKNKWYKIFNAGIYNRTANFSKNEFIEYSNNFNDLTYFCYRNPKVPGAKFICMPKIKALKNISKFNEHYILSERAPNDKIILQGEYDGEFAECSTIQEPMRFALQKQRIRITRTQLINYIGYEYYKTIDDIHNNHCQSIILGSLPILEFSFYSEPIGIHKERLIIWEIRNY